MSTPFKLVYGMEVVIPVEFIIPNLFISHATKMSDDESILEMLQDLWQLDEQHFLPYFHQIIENEIQKPWHDHHIKKSFFVGDPCYFMTVSI